jgi:chromosome segregation ATPase
VNAHQRRKEERARQREIEAAVEAAIDEITVRHANELHQLRQRHAGRLAEEVREHASLINENTEMRVRVDELGLAVDELELAVARAKAEKAEVEHELAGEVAVRQAGDHRIGELLGELEKLRAEDRDAAKLRRRLITKGERIRHLERQVQQLKSPVGDLRRWRPLAEAEAGDLR